MASSVKGVIAVRKLLNQIPIAAREGIADILDNFGTKRLAEMRRDIPVASGELRSRLSKRFSRKTLHLRVGFVGKRANGPKRLSRKVTGKFSSGKPRKINDQFVGGQFYGRFVEFGRRAQTVRVTRRAQIAGRFRSNETKRYRNLYEGAYTMRVRAMAPRPFVFKRTPLREQLRDDLNKYWDNVLKAASVGVSF